MCGCGIFSPNNNHNNLIIVCYCSSLRFNDFSCWMIIIVVFRVTQKNRISSLFFFPLYYYDQNEWMNEWKKNYYSFSHTNQRKVNAVYEQIALLTAIKKTILYVPLQSRENRQACRIVYFQEWTFLWFHCFSLSLSFSSQFDLNHLY